MEVNIFTFHAQLMQQQQKHYSRPVNTKAPHAVLVQPEEATQSALEEFKLQVTFAVHMHASKCNLIHSSSAKQDWFARV